MRTRHRPPESLLFAEFCKKFPVLRRMSRGDRFVSDCAHHHPVCPNRGNHRRSKRGRFCGDSSCLFLSSRSLPTTTLSRVDSWPPVSASKNSVPGGRFGKRGGGRSPLKSPTAIAISVAVSMTLPMSISPTLTVMLRPISWATVAGRKILCRTLTALSEGEADGTRTQRQKGQEGRSGQGARQETQHGASTGHCPRYRTRHPRRSQVIGAGKTADAGVPRRWQRPSAAGVDL